MRRQFKLKRWLALSVILAVLAFAGATLAAANAASLDWWVIASGGQGGATTSLGCTVGQWASGSGGAQLCAGFWCGAAAQYRVFLPLVLKGA
ncbi:MAG: hypothetical protein JW892_10225 [Anaerolineae bacterium]|nr:hypothetical protein [Anaerolineae bacterium]